MSVAAKAIAKRRNEVKVPVPARKERLTTDSADYRKITTANDKRSLKE